MAKELQEYTEIINKYNRRTVKLNNEIRKRTFELYFKGMPMDKAFEKALEELEYSTKLTGIILSSSIEMMETKAVIKDKEKVGRYWLNKVWPGDKVRFSTSIKRNTRLLIKSMKEQLKLGNDWVKTAKNIAEDAKIETKLPKYLDDLVKKARKAKLSKTDMAAYKRAVKKALNNIDKLSKNGAPTRHLKKAYLNLVKQTESFNEENLLKAVGRATRRRARYFAERVARTETVRANSVIIQLQIDKDNDVIGWRSVLNTRHDIYDICDIMTQFVHDRRTDVLVPYHTHCFCRIQKIYKKTGRKFYTKERATDWLLTHPQNAQKLMTKKNYEKFLNNPDPKYINNWKPFGRIPRPPKGTVIVS